MIDEELYRETFSKLRASGEAKKEILMNMQEQKNKRHFPKILRAGLIAAVLVVALAVTASAAETNLLDFIGFKLTTIFDDGFHQVAVDEDGNEWNSYNMTVETENRDGRLILKAMTQEADITDDLLDDGEAVHTFTQDEYDLTVTVTGTLEEHFIFSSSDFAGITYDSKPTEFTDGQVTTMITTDGLPPIEGSNSETTSENNEPIQFESVIISDDREDSTEEAPSCYEITLQDGEMALSRK